MRRLLMLLGSWVALVSVACAGIQDELSSGEIVPGVWNGNFKAAKMFADRHHAPLFVFLGQQSCSIATSYTRALESDAFKAWVARHAVVLVYKRANEDEFDAMFASKVEQSDYPDFWETRAWLKSVNPRLSSYPFAGIYWPTPSNVVQVAFSTKLESIPKVKGSSAKTQAEKTVALLEHYCGTAPQTISGVDGPEAPTTNFGDKKLDFSLALTDETGLAGVMSLSAAHATPQGNVAVKGTITTLDGKKRSFSKSVWYLSPEFDMTIKSLGTLSLCFGIDTVTGTLADWQLETPESIGGIVPSESLSLELDETFPLEIDGLPVIVEALPAGQRISTAGVKWSTPAGQAVRWKASTRQFEIAAQNPAQLKLTYMARTGLFKGSFNVYAYSARQTAENVLVNVKVKKYAAKVAGFVVNGQGWGRATIPGVGTYAIWLTDTPGLD